MQDKNMGLIQRVSSELKWDIKVLPSDEINFWISLKNCSKAKVNVLYVDKRVKSYWEINNLGEIYKFDLGERDEIMKAIDDLLEKQRLKIEGNK